eukprot:scpid27437/ scgid1370/ Helicase SKI2W; Helicase-like protein
METLAALNSQLEALEQNLPQVVPKSDEADFPGLELVEKGIAGECDVVVASESSKSLPTLLELSDLPFGIPPACESVDHDLEALLCHPEKLHLYDLDRAQRFIPRTIDTQSLLRCDVSPALTSLSVHRSSASSVQEVSHSAPGSSAKSSTSLSRPHGPPGAEVRGQPGNCFFWPGGMDDERPTATAAAAAQPTADVGGTEIDFENDLESTPPGFSCGMTFPPPVKPESTAGSVPSADFPRLLAFDIDLGIQSEPSTTADAHPDQPQALADDDKDKDGALQSVLEMASSGVRSDSSSRYTRMLSSAATSNEDWAVVVDQADTVPDFHLIVPKMAHEYPFQLDTFQKQAIVRLEKKECVFVAAHTSAGKTVVAEYAIAMALKNVAKTIYTSPIKALSNQKFRDFKNTFSDVGLLTGDIQINKEASCLIMTTEILRSMLYNGSDVIRDVEWVIFDEVHYINDAERGVVWEEVLIMLPDHANIILLSATIPNTKEFAGWVGRTKRKKVYVISTNKRPVPLEHFLYTGNSSKTSNERFPIVKPNGVFDNTGFLRAVEAKKQRTKPTDKFGPKGARNYANSSQDMNIYKSLVQSLEKSEQLPVVCFTFSKKRCDENAGNLRNLDLTSTQEKSRIHTFFKKSIDRLKPADRKLPQVRRMNDLLSRGVAIHHSGILPILKEVVELLFQEGLVKLLFATETFAMGVNMPARTVVFDDIQKHDGTRKRYLYPSEYIQMAGRAGRRGKDTTGTVIILAKQDVPDKAELMKMMLGKATMLQSRFRLTYTMILNLMRTSEFRVEDMMKRSFGEFGHQSKAPAQRLVEQELKHQLQAAPKLNCELCPVDLGQLYADWEILGKVERELRGVVSSNPNAVKALSPGRVIIVETVSGLHCLAVVLDNSIVKGQRSLQALVLCDARSAAEKAAVATEQHQDTFFSVSAAQLDLHDCPTAGEVAGPRRLYAPPVSAHCVMKVNGEQLVSITDQVIQVQGGLILSDHSNRQLPRFASNPPCQQANAAAEQLLRVQEASDGAGPSLFDPVSDFRIRDLDHRDKFDSLALLRGRAASYVCVTCPYFQHHYSIYRQTARVEEQLRKLEFMLSDASLELLPEYQQRVQVGIENSFVVQIFPFGPEPSRKAAGLCTVEMCFELGVRPLNVPALCPCCAPLLHLLTLYSCAH